MAARLGSKPTDHKSDAAEHFGSDGPDTLYTTSELAFWLRKSPLWVENSRRDGTGPKFIRTGARSILYKKADVLAWMEKLTHQRTDEYDRSAAFKLPARPGRKSNAMAE